MRTIYFDYENNSTHWLASTLSATTKTPCFIKIDSDGYAIRYGFNWYFFRKEQFEDNDSVLVIEANGVCLSFKRSPFKGSYSKIVD